MQKLWNNKFLKTITFGLSESSEQLHTILLTVHVRQKPDTETSGNN